MALIIQTVCAGQSFFAMLSIGHVLMLHSHITNMHPSHQQCFIMLCICIGLSAHLIEWGMSANTQHRAATGVKLLDLS